MSIFLGAAPSGSSWSAAATYDCCGEESGAEEADCVEDVLWPVHLGVVCFIPFIFLEVGAASEVLLAHFRCSLILGSLMDASGVFVALYFFGFFVSVFLGLG